MNEDKVKRGIIFTAFMVIMLVGFNAMTQKPDYTQAAPEQVRGRFPIVAIKSDYGIQFKAVVDTAKETVIYNYRIKNITKQPRKLELTHPALKGKLRVLNIAPQDSQDLRISAPIQITTLTPSTRLLRLKPYLLSPVARDKTDRPLLSNYEVDLRVQVPIKARMLKATVPFKKIAPGVLQWQMDNVKVLPPVDLWYTVSPDHIEVSAETIEQSGRATIQIGVTNRTSQTLGVVTLKMRVPLTLYYAVPDLSDGSFVLQQGIVYRWEAGIKSLGPQQTKTLSIVLDRANPNLPMKNLEIRVYNQQNELIAIEQTTSMTPFFSE
ncbi:MAG: hypothetical protein ACFFCW_26845 [Candidatus Hodarchaeota archaeon]